MVTMTHTSHPDSHVAGLADECPRCAEHAEHPLETLDESNIRELAKRTVDETPARSGTEATAMRNVEAALLSAGKLAHAAPETLELYLLERWHLPTKIRGGHDNHDGKDEHDAN